MELSDPSERRSRLLEAGVPERFLDGCEAPGGLLASLLLGVEAAYASLTEPNVEVDWSLFEDEVLTPVYGDSGDMVLVLASGPAGDRFVELVLGAGGVCDRGESFQAALAGLLFDVWEFEELTADDLEALGEELGFAAPGALAASLAGEAPGDVERAAFLAETVPRLLEG